jgi:hypothetical protein
MSREHPSLETGGLEISESALPVISSPSSSRTTEASDISNVLSDNSQSESIDTDVGPGNVASDQIGLTPYTNQNWLNELRGGFKRLIISRCSAATKEAVESNEVIKVCIEVKCADFNLVYLF